VPSSCLLVLVPCACAMCACVLWCSVCVTVWEEGSSSEDSRARERARKTSSSQARTWHFPRSDKK
jgi:hypothetical protein